MSRKDKAKNKTEQVKGKLKQVAGKATGDASLVREGKRDRARGDLKQAGEKVKDALHS
ncbi:MAG TPA: CsbD family protein [Acidimicrobiales bacterium]|nr:CsbD family protein [Acidimicrobiales bacterium]